MSVRLIVDNPPPPIHAVIYVKKRPNGIMVPYVVGFSMYPDLVPIDLARKQIISQGLGACFDHGERMCLASYKGNNERRWSVLTFTGDERAPSALEKAFNAGTRIIAHVRVIDVGGIPKTIRVHTRFPPLVGLCLLPAPS